MDFKRSLVAVTLLLGSAASHAGIIYEWQPVNKKEPHGIVLRLEFDEATVASGSFQMRIESGDTSIRPNSGLISLHYEFLNTLLPMHYEPRVAPFVGGHGTLDMNVRFAPGKLLSGWIEALDTHSHFIMGSSLHGKAPVFTITAAADQGMCGRLPGDPCSGATGVIRQVPEPAPLALLGIGALSVFAAGRRKTRV